MMHSVSDVTHKKGGMGQIVRARKKKMGKNGREGKEMTAEQAMFASVRNY